MEGLAGDDNIQVAGSITRRAWLYGGNGNDRLKGSAGHDVLLGEEGDDLLVGQSGRDVLVGGLGGDRIVGNADDDVPMAGYLTFDDVDQAVCAIRRPRQDRRDRSKQGFPGPHLSRLEATT